MHARLGGLGACFPKKLDALKLFQRSFWDRSRAECYITRGVLHPTFGCPHMHFLCHAADFEFPREKVATKVARRASEVTSLGMSFICTLRPVC